MTPTLAFGYFALIAQSLLPFPLLASPLPLPANEQLKLREAESQLISHRLPLQSGVQRWEGKDRGWVPYSANGSRITLVNLWSVDCKPCTEEMPVLRTMLASFRKNFRDFGTLIISETQDDRDLFSFLSTHPEFVEKNTAIYKVNGDHITRELGNTTIPITLLLDRNSVVRHAIVGSILSRRSELVSAMERLSRVVE